MIKMSMKNELTKKQRNTLNTWHRWGQMMSFLKAIHRELEPKKAERDQARKFIGLAN
jgi:hypothetical protein|tara:strand:- start:3135 stop:3305 length:171 start_codon:yes stop_codon:yes gene_type:complete